MGNNIINYDRKDNMGRHVVPVDDTNYSYGLQQLLYWDSTDKVAKPLGDDTNAQYFVGENEDVSPIAPYGTSLFDGSSAINPNAPRHVVNVARYVLRDIVLKTGDNADPYQALYMSDSTPTVTTGAGSHSVGYVSPDQASVVTNVAGGKIRAYIRANYPTNSLS